jgi:hypothetical protein
MVNQLYDFDAPALYNYDALKVEVSGGAARLAVQALPVAFPQAFTSPAGFVYDAAKTEFPGALMRQKSQRPAGAAFGATYTTGINGNWGSGSLVGTAVGGAAVSGGKLVLTGGTVKNVVYPAAGNADGLVQTGCIRFRFTPNYTSYPTYDIGFFAITSSAGAMNNLFQMTQNNGASTVRLLACKSDGTPFIDNTFSFGFVSGVEVEIEIDFDCTAGAHRVFKNGVQLGSTLTNIATRSSSIGYFVVGGSYEGRRSDFSIDNFELFTTVQHTANYTPGYIVPETEYAADVVTCPEMAYVGPGTLKTFTAFSSVFNNGVRFTLQIGRNGNYLYWDGAAWTVSNNTYAQANTAAEFAAHVAALDIDGEIYGQFRVYTTDGNTQADITSFLASLTGELYGLDNPTILPYQALTVDALQEFLANYNEPEGSAVLFVLQLDGVNTWWDGVAWVASTGYAEANTAADILANLADLDVASGRTLRWVAYLHSDTGVATPEILELEIIYSFWGGAPPDPQKSTVWGYLMSDGHPVVGARVRCDLEADCWYQDVMLSRAVDEVVTDATGYWEMEVIPSSLLSPVSKYRFRFTGAGVERDEQRTMPVGDTNYKNLV